MPDDADALRKKADAAREHAAKLQGLADAAARHALELEALAREINPREKKWSAPVVVSLPVGPGTGEQAERAANVDTIEQMALTAGAAEGQKAQRHKSGLGPTAKGKRTREAIEKAWRTAHRRLEAECAAKGIAKPTRKMIENAVVEHTGMKLRTVQRYAPP